MRHTVTIDDTALALGSGDVPVLGTPRLVAWLEAASVEAAEAFVDAGRTTVGTTVRINHLRATAVGGNVDCTAIPRVLQAGKKLAFAVKAVDDAGETVAEGEIERAVVDRERFLARFGG